MNANTNIFRILIDTNVLISYVISENSVAGKLIHFISKHHRLLICSYSITEASSVIARKFPGKSASWEHIIASLNFQLIYTPEQKPSFHVPQIHDEKDIPILISAVLAQPDILISGDSHFHTAVIKQYFAVYTPADFLRDFG